ncbi:hypothetical protein CF326_g8097 [Tilletia indica]|nr:hypothetical protein CF326_g8097 [Tilletia indica]
MSDKIDSATQKGWLSSIIRNDGPLTEAPARIENLACRMSRLVAISSLLHKYIVLNFFHRLPPADPTTRDEGHELREFPDLIETTKQDGRLFWACLSYFNERLKREHLQKEEAKTANNWAERYAPRFLRLQSSAVLLTFFRPSGIAADPSKRSIDLAHGHD